MALLERGKGKRKHVIEIIRFGRMLRMQETEAGDRRLPGYRRFQDEAAAIAALAVEVAALIEAGMEPADDEAQAIAAARSKVVDAQATLPVRRDFAVYNEATGFVITSRRMAGKTLDEGSAEWKKAVTRGDMVPVTLVQDDPFVVRVVAGAPLNEQEEAEWVGKLDWHLNVPDGRLCVTGGSVFTNDDYDEDDPSHEQYVGELAVPKGRYRATLYTHAHGVNGGRVLDHLAGGDRKTEPFDRWFARTRPGEAPPDWDDLELVDFLVHLEPIDAAPKNGRHVLPEDGWFGGMEHARKPERCPLGLVATDVVRTSRDESTRTWTYVRSVFDEMPQVDRRPVRGGPVSLAVESLARAARIAWFGSRLTSVELRLTPPLGMSLDIAGEWPEGIVAVAEGGVGRVLFDADLDAGAVLELLPGLASRIAMQPVGTVIDMCCFAGQTMPGSPEEVGLLSLRGILRDAEWRIAQAYPATDAATLLATLSLAEEIEGGTSVRVADDTEGNAILAWARRNFGVHLKENPPRIANGAIRFQKAGREVGWLGIAAFAHRFAGTWPVVDLAAVDEGEDDDGGDGLFPSTPIKGAEVLSAAGGRIYHQTMAMLVSEKAGAEIPKLERPLFSAGFRHVGDVVCSAVEAIGIRGYARPDGTVWACFLVSAVDEIRFEVVSVFGDGRAVLVTTANADERDDATSGVFRQGFRGAAPKDLLAHHDTRLAELTATLGPPRPAALVLRSLAETMENVLVKSRML